MAEYDTAKLPSAARATAGSDYSPTAVSMLAKGKAAAIQRQWCGGLRGARHRHLADSQAHYLITKIDSLIHAPSSLAHETRRLARWL